ncbi:MAG: RNA-binding S4 domain-containing protein [Pseudomonadota bacterium]
MTDAPTDSADTPRPKLRIDKWLYQARFFKTRGLAGEVATTGRLRLNGRHCTKAAQTVSPGDELSFPQANRIRAIRVIALGTRRGPASEAALLYEDLAPEPPRDAAPQPGDGSAEAVPAPGSGPRPTKRQRSEIVRLRRPAP